MSATTQPDLEVRTLLSKVPEVTLFFWIIKVLCTTIGETAADFLNTNLHLGLSGTTLVMGALLRACWRRSSGSPATCRWCTGQRWC